MTQERRSVVAPSRFARLTAVYTVAAAAALGAATPVGPPPGGWRQPQLWLLIGLTLAVELLPIRLPRHTSTDLITVSSPFALALLFLYGPFAAIATWTTAALVADLVGRLGPLKATFNASQYALSMAAAALALALCDGHPPLALDAAALPAMLVSALVFFVVNHVLAGVGVALLDGAPVLPFLARDLGFLSWTMGFQLALAPLLLGAPGALAAIGALPVLAIYLGGRQAAAVAHRASHDALTALPNRSVLDARLADALGRNPVSPDRVWVALVDLDEFKSVNDTLGHACGDTLLVHVAKRIAEVVRRGDLLARVGGDEFALLLVDIDEDDALACVRRVLESLHSPLVVDDLALQVSASAGLARADDNVAAQELLERADTALVRAKDDPSRLVLYSGGSRSGAAIDRLALGAALQEALDTGAIEVHFQAKIAGPPDLPPSMEALARWRHPALGPVDPGAFIAVAEETGMIKRLTAHVLDAALARCALWRREGMPLRMAVNLSAKSLVDHSLPALIAETLERHGLPGEALQLEITESAAVANLPRSAGVVDALRALGVTLAIDDFGTGYSSLSQLQQLPVEEIKIDRSFVFALDADEQAAVIVRSIVNLGHSLGLRVTAEGVETPEALRRVRHWGCDYAQGFIFGQPSLDQLPTRPLTAVA
jgi:diguanylate cyclase (GGDEF)-like protein